MKLTIEIDGKDFIESYLSIVSLGILDCLERKMITYDNSMQILYFPGMIEKLEKVLPGIGKAIHLGTELEDVEELIPDKLTESIEEIRSSNYDSIKFKKDQGQHVFYKIDE